MFRPIKEIKRQIKFFKQRREYGFDERETWDMGNDFVKWLSSHCKLYLETASNIVDLSWEGNKKNYRGKDMTQEEIIKRIIELCDDYIYWSDILYADPNPEKELTSIKNMQEALDLWGLIWRDMWW